MGFDPSRSIAPVPIAIVEDGPKRSVKVAVTWNAFLLANDGSRLYALQMGYRAMRTS